MSINALHGTASYYWPTSVSQQDGNGSNGSLEKTRPDQTGDQQEPGSAGQKSPATGSGKRDISGKELTPQEMAVLLELQRSDRRVRAHEMAHIAAGGPYIRGGVHYNYRIGPDGRSYAVSGDVSIDASAEPSPEETIRKMRVVERAAMAPADPSPQDRAVAAKAAQTIQKVQMELIKLQYEKNGSKSLDKIV